MGAPSLGPRRTYSESWGVHIAHQNVVSAGMPDAHRVHTDGGGHGRGVLTSDPGVPGRQAGVGIDAESQVAQNTRSRLQ